MDCLTMEPYEDGEDWQTYHERLEKWMELNSTRLDSPQKQVAAVISLLGIANYYCKFIPDYSHIAKPLTQMLRAENRWSWTSECAQAVNEIKYALSNAPVLAHFDPTLPLILSCDASPVGLGAVLGNSYPDGSERPIAYASRTLSRAEENYAQLEKEALGIVFGVKRFHEYLYGRMFTLITDNQPLARILGPKSGIPTLAAARLQRWSVILVAYTFEVKCKRSAENANSDALLRLPLATDAAFEQPDIASIMNIAQIETLPVLPEELRRETMIDSVCQQVLEYTRKGWPSEEDPILKPYWKRKDELTIENDCLLWGRRVVIPLALQTKVLNELHGNHDGVVRMKSLARLHVWWPELETAIEPISDSCRECARTRNTPPRTHFSWPQPTKVWDRIHLDFAGPVQRRMLFVVVDSFSKWLKLK